MRKYPKIGDVVIAKDLSNTKDVITRCYFKRREGTYVNLYNFMCSQIERAFFYKTFVLKFLEIQS